MPDKRVLAVFAHPDDETFRVGGTLALLARMGVKVQVLTATRGSAGSCGKPPLCSKDELPALREKELHCACKVLGLVPPILLNYQDGKLSEVNPERIVSEIVTVIREWRPKIMITFGEDGLSGHPDHVAVGRFALEAFNQSGYVSVLYIPTIPISVIEKLGMTQINAVDDEIITHTVDVNEVWETKMAAIQCHRTQLGESPILKCDLQNQRLFLGREHFRLAKSKDVERDVDIIKWLGK
ncbi:PIG-L deacetylase family protein [Vibrio sp.]|uniref:PIG-L deacetylase family protein n=1 Tax=Vibrio sp. TaxID=678 RepID=UPI003D114E03